MKISICMATRNNENSIYSTLRSIQKQTYSDFEVVIVDDFSTDKTVEIIQDNFLSDERFKLYVGTTDKNNLYVTAHNKGIEFATGDYIVRFDADDYMLPEYVEEYVKAIQLYPNIDIFFTPISYHCMNDLSYQELSFTDDELSSMSEKNNYGPYYEQCVKEFENCPAGLFYLCTEKNILRVWHHCAFCAKREFLIKHNIKMLFFKYGDDIFFQQIGQYKPIVKVLKKSTFIYNYVLRPEISRNISELVKTDKVYTCNSDIDYCTLSDVYYYYRYYYAYKSLCQYNNKMIVYSAFDNNYHVEDLKNETYEKLCIYKNKLKESERWGKIPDEMKDIDTLVSICMAVHNVEDYISVALNSIVNQTYQNFEVIIVDDYSTDNTASIIYNQFCKRDKRFKFFCNIADPNLKYTDAHNKSYALATGDYLVRFDGDDVMYPKHIETIVSFMNKNLHVDACCTLVDRKLDDKINGLSDYYSSGKRLPGWERREDLSIDPEEVKKFNEFPAYNYNDNILAWFNQASCIRKSWFDKYHPKFEFLKNGDFVFWWKVLGLGATLYKIPEFTLIYREHMDSICHSDDFKSWGPDYDWQIDIAANKVKAFEKYDPNTKIGDVTAKYLTILFNNTVEYFKKEKEKNNG